MHAMPQVIFKQGILDRGKALFDGGGLGDYVDAISIVLHQPLQSADLAFYPLQLLDNFCFACFVHIFHMLKVYTLWGYMSSRVEIINLILLAVWAEVGNLFR